jgi:predicted ATPase
MANARSGGCYDAHAVPRAPANRRGFIRELRLDRTKAGALDAYPYTIPAIASLETLKLDPAVTIFVGENGSGKSTLVEAIAVRAGFNAEGGSRHFAFSTRASQSSLHEALVLVRNARREKTGFFLRAESLFNVATIAEQLGLGRYGWEALHEKSHGEAFLWLLEERFGPNGLYVLDEPEAALSPQRQLAALAIFHRLVAAGSQLVIATHSPILMGYPGALLYRLDAAGIARVAYEETEHYTVTRGFLTSPERYLKHLLHDDLEADPGAGDED